MLFGGYVSFGQDKLNADQKLVPQAALEHLKKNKQALKLSDNDLAEVMLSSQTLSKKSGIKHLYLQQMHQGIEIHNAITTLNMSSDNEVVSVSNQFVTEASKKVKASKAGLSAEAAVAAAANHLNLSVRQSLSVQKKTNNKNQEVLFSTGGISLEPIPAKLVYQPMADGSLRLAWEVTIDELDAQNWWVIRVDAATGEFLEKDNLVVHCEFDNDGPGGVPMSDSYATYAHKAAAPAAPKSFNFATTMAEPTANYYNVYPLTTESPTHGPRVFVGTDAADKSASPRGWHYTPVGDMTTTRGNNVYAYEDPNGTNPFPTPANNFAVPNYSPDGGSDRKFDFPIDFTKQPDTYKDAAITNLFYWNNVIHDMWYQYGFDEVSGNFQFDNFGKGGLGNDFVRAEAQDARVTSSQGPQRDNANFGTPPDGSLPRMQMYLWKGIPDRNLFRVTSPSTLAGAYQAIEAVFSRPLTSTPVTGKLVLTMAPVTTPTGRSEEGCGAFTNAAAINGNIAVVYRGTCGFADKVQNAQIAGAIAVVVINNAPGAPIAMGGTPTVPQPAIVIPAVMISQADGAGIRSLLDAQTEVTVALKNDGAGPEFDGDFDNGIIAHEYGHGISTRLTGGPANVTCLNNAEQMGEGWSDWFGLMMTIKPGDTGSKVRGIGTYVKGQPTTGLGIRPAPYSTDFGVNNFTYAATNNTATISQPHGIGFVWSTMLWDMTWELINKYGYDADLYNGTGGNNMAMQLVIDGLKLQVCSPGFVDGRDAILLADVQNNGGANQELIWRAFAKRGLGFSAKQGLSTSRIDQVQAFDLPPVYACSAPVITATAIGDTFVEEGQSTIYLGYGPQSIQLQASGDPTFVYTWGFVPGLSDLTIPNPVFTPKAAGTYELTLTSVNKEGCSRTVIKKVAVVDVRCGFVFIRNNKVLVCHNGRPTCVTTATVADHLKHGDSLGECQQTSAAGLVAEEKVAAEEVLTLTATPNPTSSQTWLDFTLTQTGNYRLEVMNMQGTVVGVVAEGIGRAGENFSFKFTKGRLAAGIYMVRLTSGQQNKFTRIVLQD
ncbi:peptidase M36 fungalysin [Hymenobacter roseosalivarius DSM 11622]|uniref:Peptidase M36 fungalysin n=2 Tax=Hymenobacter roseosalivarius TaxID=89967 RepID=A0A1W1VSA0_9BACT|nr:peptidase M36 fungalysin [Hymenobacter roseosalivarius DSM 11622]